MSTTGSSGSGGSSGNGDGWTNPPSYSISSLPAIQRLLGRENWTTWKFAVQSLMELEELWDVVKPTPNDDGTLPAVDQKKDRRAKAKIILLLDPINYVHVQDAKSASEAWSKLENAFEDSGTERKVGLLSKLINTRLVNCTSMSDYVNRIVSTSHQLRGIGFDVSEEWVGALLLAGLPPEYKPMVMAISSSGIAIKGDLIKTKLLQEMEEPSMSSVLVTKNQQKPYVHNDKQPVGQNSSKGPKCRCCHKFGHIAKNCPSKASQGEKKGNAFCTVLSTIEDGADDWYFDSGATTHLTKNRNLLNNLRPGSGTVVAANKGTMQVEAIGDMKLTAKHSPDEPEIDVRNVQLISELSTNLLSVSQIVENGNKVIFDKTGCQVMNAAGEIFATGSRKNGLFKFDQAERSSALTCSKMTSLELWHRRMGHLHLNGLKQLKKDLVTGISFEEKMFEPCKVCALGKQTRLPFKKEGHRAKEILETVHSDICGPMEEPSVGGNRYFITFADDKSRRIYVYFLRSKSAEEVQQAFEEYYRLAERQTGRKLMVFRSDNGKEYLNRRFQELLKKLGVRHQTTVDYTPEQNGLAERSNRSIVERARCMLYEANLPKRFWAEAVATSVYLLNRSPTKGHDLTPEEMWSGRKPDLAHLRIFGTTVMAHVPRQKRQKWDAKAQECILVGYEEDSKGYRLYNTKSRTIIKSRDVTFLDEGRSIKNLSDGVVQITVNEGPAYVKLDLIEVTTERRPIHPGQTSQDQDQEVGDDDANEDFEDAIEDVTFSPALPSRTSSNPPESQVLRRSGRERAIPGKLKDFIMQGRGILFKNLPGPSANPGSEPIVESNTENESAQQSLVAKNRRRKLGTKRTSDDPQTPDEALNSDESSQWKAAMEEEYSALINNETWKLVDPPPDRKIVGCKWIFKTKRDESGMIVRHKARLVAQGFTQKYGCDYDEVFAPVVRQTTLRTLLAVAAKRNMVVKQYDVKTAFLNGDLEEEIYMRQPPGFISKGNEGKVCKLKRSLYGLKQAARAWNQKLNAVLEQDGFKRCKADPCLYTKTKKGKKCYVLVYVDDLIIASETDGMIKHLVAVLEKHFDINSLGDIRYYLGIEVERNPEGDYFINQRKYIDHVVNGTGLADAKISKYPLDAGYQKNEDRSEPLPDNHEYQKVVGQLLYLAVNTRPDISAAVSILSRKTSAPTQTDWTELKRVIRYLKGTSSYRLRLSRTKDNEGLIGYADADWAECSSDRKSNSGQIFKFNGGTISWSCRKQTCVSLSTAEAEFIALAEATQEALWLKQLLMDLDEPVTLTILEDNQSCLKMLEGEKFSNRTKHISIKYNFVRDICEKNEVKFVYCPTEDMVADLLTKPLAGIRISKLARASGLEAADRGGVLE